MRLRRCYDRSLPVRGTPPSVPHHVRALSLSLSLARELLALLWGRWLVNTSPIRVCFPEPMCQSRWRMRCLSESSFGGVARWRPVLWGYPVSSVKTGSSGSGFWSSQVGFCLENLTSKLNFIVKYLFLLVVELHIYIDSDFNLI